MTTINDGTITTTTTTTHNNNNNNNISVVPTKKDIAKDYSNYEIARKLNQLDQQVKEFSNHMGILIPTIPHHDGLSIMMDSYRNSTSTTTTTTDDLEYSSSFVIDNKDYDNTIDTTKHTHLSKKRNFLDDENYSQSNKNKNNTNKKNNINNHHATFQYLGDEAETTTGDNDNFKIL